MAEAPSIRVLLIEDDDDVRASTEQALSLAGFKVDAFASAERARPLITFGVPAIVVCDVRLPGLSGVEWLSEIRRIDAEIPVVLVTGHGHIAMAVEAMREGAYDFIEKPFTSERLVAIARHAVERRQLTLELRVLRDTLDNWHGIQAVLIGRSAQMQQVRRTVLALAETSADVLIYGETGTGKELVARCLHDHSERRRQHFVPLNCGGLPEALAESELFGHEAGAFTSAHRARVGKFEHANGGTLFLDEIESMPLAVQIKLLRALRDALENWHGIQAMLIGRSAQMQQVRRTVMTLAETSADVLIYGETGTGKELVARCLHEHSERRRQHFVPLNCGGLPEALAESELFGHEAGAFTSANRVRVGKFEYANGGTLFLDEIESMPMAVQIKLLRALQERSIERIGSNRAIPFDCRVVAASKDDLKDLSDRQKFRADLYYRIAVAFIELPPLRERREDIPLLFEHFTLLAASRYERPAPVVSSDQLADLMAYAWPGNVRELRNVADRFVLGLLGGGRLTQQHGTDASLPQGLPQQVESFERAVIVEALRKHHGDQSATAAALSVPRQTLFDKLRKLGVAAEQFK